MKLEAPERRQVPVLDPITRTQIGTKPEPVEDWLFRGWATARQIAFEQRGQRPEFTIVVNYDVRRELLQTLPYTMVGLDEPTHLFGAVLEKDFNLPVAFEVRWESDEEAVQASINHWARQLSAHTGELA